MVVSQVVEMKSHNFGVEQMLRIQLTYVLSTGAEYREINNP